MLIGTMMGLTLAIVKMSALPIVLLTLQMMAFALNPITTESISVIVFISRIASFVPVQVPLNLVPPRRVDLKTSS